METQEIPCGSDEQFGAVRSRDAARRGHLHREFEGPDSSVPHAKLNQKRDCMPNFH